MGSIHWQLAEFVPDCIPSVPTENVSAMLLREIKNIFHLELDKLYPKEEVDSFFYISVERYLGLERFILALRPELIISKEDEQPLFEALAQLKLHRPIQYIIGKTTFMDLELYVNENVLIPRPETEELVRWMIQEVRSTKNEVRGSKDKKENGSEEVLQGVVDRRDLLAGLENQTLQILDIGTGSGCIAISLAKNVQNAKIYALDVSEKALEVAKRNAKQHQVKIEFILTDILEEVIIDEKFDIIVANPPYVRESEKNEMSKNVLEHEPGAALFVPDDDPLRFYKSISEFASLKLNKGGKLYLEINQYLAKETQQLLKEYNFKDIELRKDLLGNDRMLKGTTPS